MHYLSACCYFNDKGLPNVSEFMDYHLAVGFNHFFLINRQPDTSNAERVCKPYIDKGLATLLNYPSHAPICAGHNDALWHASLAGRGKTHWMAFLDTDEFIMPMQKNSVAEVMQEFEQYDALIVNWQIFGTSGLIKNPPSHLKYLHHRAEWWFGINSHVKTIAKPETITHFASPHCVGTTNGRIVNEKHEVHYGSFSPISVDKIRINHYVIKSKEEFQEDMRSMPYKTWEFFEKHNRNEIHDDEIWRRFGAKIQEVHQQVHGDNDINPWLSTPYDEIKEAVQKPEDKSHWIVNGQRVDCGQTVGNPVVRADGPKWIVRGREVAAPCDLSGMRMQFGSCPGLQNQRTD